MNEIEDGLWHWDGEHPNHGQRVSSHAYVGALALIDPLMGGNQVEALGFDPELIVLSCRHHRRDSPELAERFDIPVLVPESGMDDFAGDEWARAFKPGDSVADGLRAIDIDALSPDETAIHIDAGPGALLIADGVMRDNFDGDLGFVSDGLLGDDPESVKRDVRAQFAKVLETCPPFEHLLFAHGAPILGDGRAALQDFVS